MKKLILSLCLLAAYIFPNFTALAKEEEPEKIVVGYYAGWAAYKGYTPDQLPVEMLTHINYAFAKIDPASGKVVLADPSMDHKNLKALQQLKKKNPHLKVLLSVGGWDYSAYFSDVALTPEKRETFARSCIELIINYELDGVDLDWEYPVSGGKDGNVNRPEDQKNFTLLLRAVRDQLNRQGEADGHSYLLTIAAAANSGYLKKIEPEKAAGIVDFVFLMSYDYHGPWDSYADLNAPLYMPSEWSPQYKNSVDDSIQTYLRAGIPAGKIVMGVPLYGYLYEQVSEAGYGLYSQFSAAKSISYDALKSQYIHHPGYRQLYHAEARVPYLYGEHTFITYENAKSVSEKARLAARYQLAGIGFWELSQDTEGVLISSACGAFTDEWINPFDDVDADAWFYSAVRYMHSHNFMSGTHSRLFSPSQTITRGMFTAVLFRIDGGEADGVGESFADVQPHMYYAPAVAWAYQNNIVGGYSAERFGPNDAVTREQMAAILYRYAKYKAYEMQEDGSLSAFIDADQISPYARTAMQWAVQKGLFSGYEDASLRPSQTASRAEAAAILTRFCQTELD